MYLNAAHDIANDMLILASFDLLTVQVIDMCGIA